MNFQDKIYKVKTGEMSHMDYLKSSDDFEDYKNWCASHNEEICDRTAEFYFDMTYASDYSEADVLIEA